MVRVFLINFYRSCGVNSICLGLNWYIFAFALTKWVIKWWSKAPQKILRLPILRFSKNFFMKVPNVCNGFHLYLSQLSINPEFVMSTVHFHRFVGSFMFKVFHTINSYGWPNLKQPPKYFKISILKCPQMLKSRSNQAQYFGIYPSINFMFG